MKKTVTIVFAMLLAFVHTLVVLGQTTTTVTNHSLSPLGSSKLVRGFTLNIGNADSVKTSYRVATDSLFTQIVIAWTPFKKRLISGNLLDTMTGFNSVTKYWDNLRVYSWKNGVMYTNNTIPNASATTLSCITASASHTNVTCSNLGSATLTVVGGTSPITYLWSNAATTQNLTNVAAGTYSVTIKDSGNVCQKVVSGIVISNNTNVLIVSTKTDVSCFGGSNGLISLTLSGGTFPYSCVWSNGMTTQNITGLTAGIDSVTVTDSTGCVAGKKVVITQPVILTGTAVATPVACNGNASGKIVVSASGGTTPYTYSKNGVNFQSSSTFNGLLAGNYNITIKDAKLCTKIVPATITQPTALLVSCVLPTLSCFNDTGTVVSTVSGGRLPYIYNWGGGITSHNLNGVSAGTCALTVTDSNGCQTSTNSLNITQPAEMIVSPTVTNVTCGGSNTGSITLIVSGGTAPFTYSWADGPTVPNRFNLVAGTYTVTITDANGCHKVLSYTITQNLPLVINSVTPSNATCAGLNNGQIVVSASGGTGNKSYSKNGGNSFQTSNTFTNLAAGNYSIIVKDQSNSCQVGSSATVTGPTPIVVTYFSNNPSCNGCNNGAINITPTGGTPPYSFSWNNNQTTQNLSGLMWGSYTVMITDASGCNTSTTIQLIPNQTVTTLGSTNGTISSIDGNCQYNLFNTCTVQAQVDTSILFNQPSYSNLQFGVVGQGNLTNILVSFPAQPTNSLLYIRFVADDFYGNHIVSQPMPFHTPVNTTGIDDPTMSDEISLILPNNGMIKLKVRNIAKSSLSVYNVLGAKVIDVVGLVNGENVLSDLPAGVYIYQLMEGKEVFKTGKLLVR